MNTKRMYLLAAVVVGMGLMGASAKAQYGQYGPPPPRYVQPGYGAPVQNDFAQRGYADGVQGAERDAQNHRIWDVNNRDEYRKPHVPGYVRGDYREGFRRGYYDTVRRFEHGRGPYPR